MKESDYNSTYHIKMRTALCLLLLAAAVMAVTIELPKITQLSTSKRALQFNNFSGAGVRQEHITAFTNFANSASAFYKSDVQANAQYIKEQMDAQFGVAGQNFFVIIQTDPAKFSWLVWVTNENLIGSLTDINRINSDWSYLFLKFLAPTTSPDYVLITPGSKGTGVTEDTESLISSVVATYEGDGDCTCDDYDTMNIGYGLINGQGAAWSTICDATGSINAHVYTVGGQWISTKPKNCWYTFYVSQ
jgi:hypothetical protein